MEVELIGPDRLAELEPNLPPGLGGAAFFTGANLSGRSGRMMGLIAGTVLQKARHIRSRAEKLTRGPDGVVIEGPGLHLHARRVVIAAGAQSRALARQVGDRIPLDTERGYHVEWDMAEPLLSRPRLPHRARLLLLPDGRAPARRRNGGAWRADPAALAAPHRPAGRGRTRVLPDLGDPDRDWMGFRPSIPDSLPVIGPSAGGPEVIHAFGHGHLGVTMAPITARIVSALIAGCQPGLNIAPYSPGRF